MCIPSLHVPRVRLLSMAALFLAVLADVHAQIIGNGDFESPELSPWRWVSTNIGGVHTQSPFPPQSGAQFLRVGNDENYIIEQNFTVTVGGKYELGWYDRGVPDLAFPGILPAPYAVSVFNASGTAGEFDYRVNLNSWLGRTQIVSLTPGPNTLRIRPRGFVPMGPGGSRSAGSHTYIDNVTLTLVLEAPVITTQPQSQIANEGATVTLVAAASGSPTPAWQWRRNGVAIPGATSPALTLSNVTAADAATYSAVASNSVSTVISSSAVLTVQAPSRIIGRIADQVANVGDAVSFPVVATGLPAPAIQWERSVDGGQSWTLLTSDGTYRETTGPTLIINNARLSMAGHQFRAIVSNGIGPRVVSNAALLSIASSRLVNVSVRGMAGAGDQTLIVGIVTAGIGAKSILIRGVGPGLAQFGVSGVLGDPQITLFGGSGAAIGFNNDWGGGVSLARTFGDVGAFGLPAGSRDAALLLRLESGTTTAQINGGIGAAPGVVLAEAYDADPGLPSARIVNVSVRNHVGTADNILVVGFTLSGSALQTVLIRGIGPTLAQFGVEGALANPRLQLYRGATLMTENAAWNGTAEIAAAATSVGAFPLLPASRDSALLLTLAPGSYSAQISGLNNATGIALVEVYEVP